MASGHADRVAKGRESSLWSLRSIGAFAALALAAATGGVSRLYRPASQAVPEFSAPVIAEPWLRPATALTDYDFLRERVIEENTWTLERAEGAIVEYLRFMWLLAEAPKMELVASSDVDLVWHEHLLDTMNYVGDSQRLWGRFLHHRRARNATEFHEIPEAYARTKLRYAERFGQDPPTRFWGASTEASSMCGGGGGGLNPGSGGPVSSEAAGNNSSGGAVLNAMDRQQSSKAPTASSALTSASRRLSYIVIGSSAALLAAC